MQGARRRSPRVPQPGAAASGPAPTRHSTLRNRNVVLGRHRTSVRLEPAMWEALDEIALREGTTVNRLCERLAARRRESSLAAAIRVFIMTYFRNAATEQGHVNAGHGMLYRRADGRPSAGGRIG